MHLLHTVYMVCAVAGGTLFVCQFLLSLLGLAGHDLAGDGHDAGGVEGHDGGGDSHADHDAQHAEQNSHATAAWLLGFFTFRSIVCLLMFFGVVGLAAQAKGLGALGSLPLATVAGLGAMVAVSMMMRSVRHLQSEGNVYIRQAIGQRGVVYLSVPGKKSGPGKVNVSVRNMSVEYQAVTAGEPLPAGARIVVVDVTGPGTVEVVIDNEHGRTFNV